MRRTGLLILFAGLTFGHDTALVQKYCVGCHNEKLKSGGLSLVSLETGAPEWQKVIVKLRAEMMPPARAPNSDAETIDRLASSIEKELDLAAAAKPNPGRPALHRLNRV